MYDYQKVFCQQSAERVRIVDLKSNMNKYWLPFQLISVLARQLLIDAFEYEAGNEWW